MDKFKGLKESLVMRLETATEEVLSKNFLLLVELANDDDTLEEFLVKYVGDDFADQLDKKIDDFRAEHGDFICADTLRSIVTYKVMLSDEFLGALKTFHQTKKKETEVSS